VEQVEGMWRFSHDKIREALLNQVTEEERPVFHRVIAEALEALYGGEAHRAGLLARHWGGAGDDEKERRYTQSAVEYAQHVGALYEVIEFRERLLHLLAADDEAMRAELLVELGYDYLMTSQFEAAERYRREGLDLAQRLQTVPHVEIEALLNRAFALVLQSKNDPEGMEAIQTALALAEKVGHPRGIVRSHNLLGVGLIRRGQLGEAQTHLEKAMTVARGLNVRAMEASLLGNLGALAYYQGDYAQARAYWSELLPINREMHMHKDLCRTLNNLGVVYWQQGEYAEAKGFLTEALDLYRGRGVQLGMANSLSTLGFVYAELGEMEQVRPCLDEALLYAMRLDAHGLMLDIVAGLANWYEKIHLPERAAELLGFVMTHPAAANNKNLQFITAPIESRVKEELVAEAFESYFEHGKTLTVAEIAEQY
jgi:tetratricopeptide (TPR) repeat protein